MADILLLNGPNLNLLGSREPTLYGSKTLKQIVQGLINTANEHNFSLQDFQSNAEHLLVDKIHLAIEDNIRFILFNPAGFTHTSVILRDALLGVNIPFIEIHMSNIYQREKFRHHSYFSDIAKGTITGFGSKSYELALLAAISMIE